MRRLAVVIAALCALVSACNVPLRSPFPDVTASTQAPRLAPPSSRVSTRAPAPAGLMVIDYTMTRPPTVTGTWAGKTCHLSGRLPDPFCTPGSVAPRAREQVCVPGFSMQVRPTSSNADRAKTAALRAYGLQYVDRKTVELDHLVPLSLGGSNDVTNLWPERSDIPNAGFRNRKDAVEDKIHDAVCRAGSRIALEDAQSALAHDWTTALTVLGVK